MRHGPGPGAYGLPPLVGYNDHDVSKTRYPMYSFGLKTGTHAKHLGPGPNYMTHHMNQHGRDNPPAWSFGLRTRQRFNATMPAPGAHSPEKCPLMKEQRPPAYSMGVKLDRGMKGVGPGPNAYALNFKDHGPAFFIGSRVGAKQTSQTPGPIYYQQNPEVYLPTQPKFTFGGRHNLGAKGMGPGPAHYYPRKEPRGGYSFGVRHSEWAPPMIVEEDNVGCKDV